MIYDCITLFNSLELLELRLMTLYDIVHRFVIIESAMSHIRQPKPYYYEENKIRFEKYSDKIIYIKLPELPSDDPRENEAYQRNCASYGIKEADPDDYIMTSDEDEIPSAEAILEGIGNDRYKIRLKLFYYYVNCLQDQLWDGPVLIKKKYFTTAQDARNNRGADYPIMEGGWHYSFLGGLENIKLKLNSFSEQQVNTPDVNNESNILTCLETGEDIFHRTEAWAQKRFLTFEELDHKELTEWLEKYPHNFKS